jgi:hypothetical protein
MIVQPRHGGNPAGDGTRAGIERSAPIALHPHLGAATPPWLVDSLF